MMVVNTLQESWGSLRASGILNNLVEQDSLNISVKLKNLTIWLFKQIYLFSKHPLPYLYHTFQVGAGLAKNYVCFVLSLLKKIISFGAAEGAVHGGRLLQTIGYLSVKMLDGLLDYSLYVLQILSNLGTTLFNYACEYSVKAAVFLLSHGIELAKTSGSYFLSAAKVVLPAMKNFFFMYISCGVALLKIIGSSILSATTTSFTALKDLFFYLYIPYGEAAVQFLVENLIGSPAFAKLMITTHPDFFIGCAVASLFFTATLILYLNYRQNIKNI